MCIRFVNFWLFSYGPTELMAAKGGALWYQMPLKVVGTGFFTLSLFCCELGEKFVVLFLTYFQICL